MFLDPANLGHSRAIKARDFSDETGLGFLHVIARMLCRGILIFAS